MGSMEATNDFNIILIGAGISGINCAYRLQTQLPDVKFVVLEGRDSIGGTWDLFKYPGIRSDSDLHTFGFAWHSWPHPTPIAEGELIMSYLHECCDTYDLNKYIKFKHKVLSADWSSKAKKWTLNVDNAGAPDKFTTSMLVLCTGYYDYEKAFEADIPGLANFKGKVIHPQWWPADYDLHGKNMVVIGSGATTITLLPSLAREAGHVTMLQRSPTWIMPITNRTPGADLMRRFLPRFVVSWMEWLFFAIVPRLKVLMCLHLPAYTRRQLSAQISRMLPHSIPFDPHFNPQYDPWKQRVCLCPDGDFFKCLHDDPATGEKAKADVVTGTIRTVTEDEVVCKDGQKVRGVDTIVTATGLRLCFGAQIPLRVDGREVRPADKWIWQGCMLNEMPNLFFMMGYARASWTLGADDTAFILCRTWRMMQRQGAHVAVPRLDRKDWQDMERRPFLDLTSTYVVTAKDRLPKYGTKGPWRARGNVWADWVHARWGNLNDGLELTF